MRKYIYILATILLLTSCSNNQNKREKMDFTNDEIAFIHSMELFKDAQLYMYASISKAQESMANNKFKDSIVSFYIGFKKGQIASNEKYNAVLKESQKVSDEYLDYLDPQLRIMYREKFIGAINIIHEELAIAINTNYNKVDSTKDAKMNIKTDEMITSYWRYILSHQSELQAKNPAVLKAILKIISE